MKIGRQQLYYIVAQPEQDGSETAKMNTAYNPYPRTWKILFCDWHQARDYCRRANEWPSLNPIPFRVFEVCMHVLHMVDTDTEETLEEARKQARNPNKA